MKRRELPEILQIAMTAWQAGIHTVTIGRVERVGDSTIDVQPVIDIEADGKQRSLPLFTKVPPIFLSGGSSYIATPISAGDYALIIVTERCFDRWYNGADNELPLEQRMHDYSDGFALVGIQPFISAITIPQETTINGVMRLGVASPSDFVALAGKVLDELELIKKDFDDLKSAYDAHTHPSPAGGSTGAPSDALPTAHTPASVASAYVKAD